MSIQKLHTVQKSRKDQGKCGRCGDPLPAGTPYRYWSAGFRMRGKYVRCLKSVCDPRPSERETGKAQAILAAQESFDDNLAGLTSPDDIEAEVHSVGEALREVADEYEEAVSAWEHGNEQLQEKADHYSGQADELESWTWDGDTDYTLCDEHVNEDVVGQEAIDACEDCQQNKENWLQECRDAADEAVQNVELA